MTEAETAYVAGLLEGEGCFDFNRSPKYVRVRIEMTDEDVIRRLHTLVGGRLSQPRNRRPERWKDSWLIVINGDAAVELMHAVLPWLGKRRRERIIELLDARDACVT